MLSTVRLATLQRNDTTIRSTFGYLLAEETGNVAGPRLPGPYLDRSECIDPQAGNG